jgi:hypothetical protein
MIKASTDGGGKLEINPTFAKYPKIARIEFIIV